MSKRVVYITGAASGIGLATAYRFGAEGATLAICDINEAAVAQARRALVDRCDVPVMAHVSDLGTERGVASFVDAAFAEVGAAEVLVNSVGIARMGTVLQTSTSDWDDVFNTNVRSVFLTSKAVLPSMAARGGGAIVNVASEAAMVGFSGYAAYAASKAAVVNLTRCMALDHAAQKIRVNAVCPGSIDTPLLQQYFDASDDPQEARRLDAAAHPLGIGVPEDVAAAIHYLSSDDAKYITGHALVIDGGYTAQ